MVALTKKTPLPGSLTARLNSRPTRGERRRTHMTDMTLYNEKGQPLGEVRAVNGAPEFGPDALELFLDRGV